MKQIQGIFLVSLFFSQINGMEPELSKKLDNLLNLMAWQFQQSQRAPAPVQIFNTQHTDTQTTTAITQHAQLSAQQTVSGFSPASLAASLTALLWAHKFKLIFLTLLSTYGAIAGTIVRMNYVINKPDLWACWKQHLSYEELCGISNKQLEDDLLFTIQQHYLNAKNPTDSITPFVRFVAALEYEVALLNRYIWIGQWLNRLHIMRLFPIDDARIKQAEQKLHRLHFVKHIFLSWAATYNIGQIHAAPAA